MKVSALEQILFLPLRLKPRAALAGYRRNPNLSPVELLDRYADTLTHNGGGPWRVQTDWFDAPLMKRLGITREQQYAELVYFHPFIQQVFHSAAPGKNHAAIRILTRDDVGHARVHCQDGPQVLLCVPRVQIYLFPNDVAVLTVQLRLPDGSSLDMDDLLRHLDQSRRTFPPYWSEPGQAGACPLLFEWLNGDPLSPIRAGPASDFSSAAHIDYVLSEHRPPMAAHWRWLLSPMEPESAATNAQLTFEQFEDERMPAMAWAAVDSAWGIDRAIPRPAMVRLGLMDGPGSGYPYSETFLKDFEEKHCYDRFWDPPRETTRYLLTGYSFVALGRAADPFFSSLIRSHFQQHYFLLGLIAYQQQASLLVFWDRLAEISHTYANVAPSRKSRDTFRRDLKWLSEDFADFTSRFWFSEVSNQVQPRELFRMWTGHLGNATLYGEVQEQIRLLRDVQGQAEAEERERAQAASEQFQDASAEFQNAITRWTWRLTPFFATTAFLGMDNAFQNVRLGVLDWTRVALFVAIYLVAWLLCHWLQPHKGAVPTSRASDQDSASKP